jgi:hypothetical protein
LARHEGDFRLNEQEPLSLNELIALLGESDGDGDRTREEAIACYLSGGRGWRDAVTQLGGRFAGRASGLRERKED